MGFHRPPPAVVLAVVCVGIFVAALDQTVVYGALADMMVDIHLPITRLDQAAWIVIAYLLGYTFAMPLMGRVSDIFGHGLLYSVSLGLFMAGSVLVAIGSSLEWTIGARVLQAVGGGAVVPIAMAITADIYPAGRRAVALGVIGAAVEAGGALGPAYGGAVASWLGWRWIFWVNIPLGVLVIVLLAVTLRRGPRVRVQVDYLGGFVLSAALLTLSLGLAGIWPYFLIPASVLLFGLFVLRESRVAFPMLSLELFRGRALALANIINLLVGVALIIAMVNIPLFADTIVGLSPLEGGLRLLRLTFGLAFGALAGGYLCRRYGYRWPTIVGLAIGAVGFWLVSMWTVDMAEPRVSLDLVLCGLGLGIVIAPISTAVIESVSAGQRGVASSLVVMMRTVGMIVGLSAVTAWGMDQFRLMTSDMSLYEIMDSPDKLTAPAMDLFKNFFTACALACAVAVLPALGLPRSRGRVQVGDCPPHQQESNGDL